jgi:hypothetical protein
VHSREDRGESRGHPVYAGPLAYLLRNRFYIGEVAFKGEINARLPCLAMEYDAGKGVRRITLECQIEMVTR